jgi:rhamnulokinase
VLAGPVEATAAGNIILQAIADGRLASVAQARALMRESVKPRRFDPREADAWREATQRYRALEH